MSFDWVLLTLVPANLISYDTDKYILQTYMIISGTVVFFALILVIFYSESTVIIIKNWNIQRLLII